METLSVFYKMITSQNCRLFALQPINNKPRAEICLASLMCAAWKGLYDVTACNDRDYTCWSGSPLPVPASFFNFPFPVLSQVRIQVHTKISLFQWKVLGCSNTHYDSGTSTFLCTFYAHTLQYDNKKNDLDHILKVTWQGRIALRDGEG